jgi:hypothetical protein
VSARGWTVFALAGLAVAVVGGVGGLLVRVVDPAPIPLNTFGLGAAAMVAVATLGVTWASVGALLVIRVPANATDRYMVVVGAGFAFSILATAVAFAALDVGTPSGDRLASLAGWLVVVSTSIIGFIFYVGFIFPTGRGHTPGWHRIARACFWLDLAFGALLVIQPGDLHLLPGIANPFGIGPDLRVIVGPRVSAVAAIGAAISAVAFVGSVASLYRAAATTERQQLKWFILAIAASLAALASLTVGASVAEGPVDEVGLVVFGFAGATVPAAIGIAILRYRLYDIDRIISRTIAYAAISGILTAVFAGLVLALQAVLAPLTQGNTVAVAASTLIVFSLFDPVRGRVKAAVDRRFHRAKVDGERAAAAFADRLRDQLDLPSVVGDLASTADATVQPRKLAIWLRAAGGFR